MIDVAHIRDTDGVLYRGKCVCGLTVSSYVQKGTESRGDMYCELCGRVWNVFGQEISHPEGRGFDYAGEYDDEE
jgi:hypothetical protein